MEFDIPSKLQEAVKNYKPTKTINLVQDWVDDTLFYGIKRDAHSYLINNKTEIVPIEEILGRGYVPTTERMGKSLFPIEYLQANLNKRIDDLEPEPLHRRIRNYITTYIYLEQEEQYDFLTIWIMGTYIFMMFRYYPYIHLQGEKNSGKSTLLDLLSPIVFNGQSASSISGAALYRSVHENLPTFCIDEFDTSNRTMSESEKTLIKICKDGFKKGGKVIRCMGDNHESTEYDAYCPKIFAGIKEIEDVFADRMIRLSMKRKKEESHVQKYRETSVVKQLQTEIRNDLYIFGLKYADDIFKNYMAFDSNSDNELTHLSNRAGEMWSPIYSIAKLIDDESGILVYQESVVMLSKLDKEEKAGADESDNELVVLLDFFNKAIMCEIDECKPIDQLTNFCTFDTEDVFQYLKKEGILLPFDTKTKLTQRLKRTLEIVTREYLSEITEKTRKKYIVNLDTHRDYTSRYNNSEPIYIND